MRATSGWSIAQTEDLIKRVNEKRTGAQIARMTGRTRNAVIGKCRRMGLTLQGTRWGNKPSMGRESKVTIRRKPCEKPPVSLAEVKEVSLAPKSGEGSIRGVPDRYQCKYPVSGTGVEIVFCQNRRVGQSWCQHHQEICYTPSRY